MRNIEAYCDESRPELFVAGRPPSGRSVIGSLWFPASFRYTLKQDIAALRTQHDVWGEFKWKKVSPSKLSFYRDLVDYFFSQDALSFRAIVIDSAKLDIGRFHDSDGELGFYKFYYQLLTHWISPGAAYSVFCDDKVNRDSSRLPTLKRVLESANRGSTISTLQAVPSSQSVAIQLCDILIGATQWRANGSAGSSTAKKTIVQDVERKLGRQLAPTFSSEQKFNVFNIKLQSGAE